MWRDYVAAHPDAVSSPGADADYVVECFGDSVELADELLSLVLDGVKRATAALVAEFAAEGEPLPRVGSHWIACDGSGTPRIIIRSTELRLGPFSSVDERFAFDEGEGDRTRESWVQEHGAYWRRVAAASGLDFGEHSEVVFERFSVVWPPEYAD